MKSRILTLMFLSITLQCISQTYNVKWGELQKAPTILKKIIPNGEGDFYTLREERPTLGSAIGASMDLKGYVNPKYKPVVVGTPNVTYSQNLELSIAKEISLKKGNVKYEFEGSEIIGGKLMVFFSALIDKRNQIFMQEYDNKIQPVGNEVIIGSYEDLGKGVLAKSFFEVIRSQDRTKAGIIWEIYNKKDKSKSYGYHILDRELQTVSKGEYKLPYDINYVDIYSHHLSNTGDYFISIAEYTKSLNNALAGAYFIGLDINRDLKAIYVSHVTVEGLTKFELDLKDKKVREFKIQSNNSDMMSVTGTYGNDKKGINGLFYVLFNFRSQEVEGQSFKEFDPEFMMEDLSERKKEKAENGDLELDLDNFYLRDLNVLEDGSIVGSMEQFKMSNGSRTTNSATTRPSSGFPSSMSSGIGIGSSTVGSHQGTSQTSYMFGDIIAFKINTKGEFEWMQKIKKKQKSTVTEGLHTSYSAFIDNGNYCLMFTDNKKNYDESGKFILGENVKNNPLTLKNSVVGLVEININSGSIKRESLFKYDDSDVIFAPRLFAIDYETNQMIIYGASGIGYTKEKFGSFNLLGNK